MNSQIIPRMSLFVLHSVTCSTTLPHADKVKKGTILRIYPDFLYGESVLFDGSGLYIYSHARYILSEALG